MVLIYTISLNLGIILCNFVSSHAYPRTPDEMPIPLSLPKFLNRNHSHMPLNISTPFQSLGTIFPKNNSLFHSNNSLVGKSIPCTSDEKICLRHNMVYVPSQEVCRPIGKYLGCIVTIDRNLASGVIGICHDVYPSKYGSEYYDNIYKEYGSGFENNDERNETQPDDGQNDGSEDDYSQKEDSKEDVEEEEREDGKSNEEEREREETKVQASIKANRSDTDSGYVDSGDEDKSSEDTDRDEDSAVGYHKDGNSKSGETSLTVFHHDGSECSGYVMAYDGKCYSKGGLQDICGCDAEPTLHVFGGYECNCSEVAPIHVEQPNDDGFCRFPDFKNFDKSVSSSRYVSIYLNCSKEQMDCFRQYKIWMSEVEECFTPLVRGPCPEEHVVALNESASEDGFAEGACVHERGGCPTGYKRLRFDQKCYSDRELDIRKLNFLYVYGLYDGASNWYPSFDEAEQMCRIDNTPRIAPAFAVVNVAQPGGVVENDSGVIGARVDSEATNPSSLE